MSHRVGLCLRWCCAVGWLLFVQLYCWIQGSRELGWGLSTVQQLALLCDLLTCPTRCTNREGCGIRGSLNRQESPIRALPFAACGQLSSHALPHAAAAGDVSQNTFDLDLDEDDVQQVRAALQAASQGGALLACSDSGHLCSTAVQPFACLPCGTASMLLLLLPPTLPALPLWPNCS